jgi:hypothetical protein
MRFLPILALALLAACATRPLTPAEQAFAGTIMGPELATKNVRIVKGAVVGLINVTIEPRPRTTCRERLYPELKEPYTSFYPAFTRRNTIYFTRPFWSSDYLNGYPGTIDLDSAMRLAHELTHVWQWEHRKRTGYSPFAAAFEHVGSDDPYLIDIDPKLEFSDYGWEQQGSIVEEFVCCRTLDPGGARTAQLTRLVHEVFPDANRRNAVPWDRIRLPWKGAETKGICS